MQIMADRTRLTFDVPEPIRRALNVHASARGKTVGQIIEWMVRRLIPEDLEFAERTMASEEGGETSPAPKRGRRPKPPSDPKE